MSTPAELYVEAMEATQQIVDDVPASHWKAPSPCSEWDVRDIVNHIISENLWASELFQGKTIAEVGDAFTGDLTVGDPPAEYARSVEAVKIVLADPAVMDTYRLATVPALFMPHSLLWTCWSTAGISLRAAARTLYSTPD